MDNKFFQDNATEYYVFDDRRPYFQDEGIIFHDLNSVPYQEFPQIISRFAWGKSLAVIAPKREWNSILIPFSPLDHDRKYFKGLLISDIFKPLIETLFLKKQYIASADPNYCFFAQTNQFQYKVVESIAGGNEMTPFFIFDDSFQHCFGFDFDFEYSFFSSANLKQDDERLKGTFAEWDSFFVDNFVRSALKKTAHMELFETILRPSIPRTFNFP